MAPPRILVVAFCIHGMVRPALQLAARLAAIGAEVTFVTAIHAHRRIVMPSLQNDTLNGVSFAPFSDGFDECLDNDLYDAELTRRGSKAVSALLAEASKNGKPFSCLVYTPVMTWGCYLAEKFNIPAVLLWVQAATVFDVIHSYYHGFKCVIDRCYRDKELDKSLADEFKFLGLPFDLSVRDLPNFLDASSPQFRYEKFFRGLFERFGREKGVKRDKVVLVNTVDALETEALNALRIDGVNLIGIGPLMEFDQSSKAEGNYIQWLNSKPKRSVVYVSFGSLSVLEGSQMEEMARGLLGLGRPFIWVIRGEAKPSCEEELSKLGIIVQWCNQVEVLRNEALACFVSHCGWNSTLESLVCGVPVVAFPQRIDQLTNSKMVEDYWKVGVRVRADEESGIVGSEEIKRCLELVVKGEEFRSNANKWTVLGEEAIKGGSSEKNLIGFVNKLRKSCGARGSGAVVDVGDE